MNKKLIRLTESDLHKIVEEPVNRILKEGYYDFDDDFNADDVECPYCGSNNVEPISAIDTHYKCLDCGEEFYLDDGWEPDWGAMRHESHKRKGKNINEATTPTWKRWQGYTPDQKAERLAYMQQQIAQLKQQREYAKQKAKTARTPEEQQVWRNTKTQIDKELLRVVSHEHDLRVGKKMSQGAKERATIKRREDRAKAKNRITFQPQDDPYYTNESKNMNKKLIRLTESDLHRIVKESVNRVLNEIGDTSKGQRALGGLHARKVLRNNDLSRNTYDYAEKARGGDKYDNRGNNDNPLYHDYANGYVDYLNSHPSEYMDNKRKRMAESKEDYDYIMSVRNNPIFQQELKKAWEKEKLTNPNPDWDTFEYDFALRCLDKEREEDAKHYYKMRKIQRQLDNNTRKNV